MTKEKRPQTFDHLKTAKQPTFKRCYIVMDSDVVEQIAAAEGAVSLAQISTFTDDSPETREDLRRAQEKLDDIRAQAKEDAFEFVFRSIGRKRYDALVMNNEPTDADRQAVEREGGDPTQLRWSPESFPAALIAEASHKPKLTIEEVRELWDSDDWTAEDLGELFTTAMAAQQARRVVQLGNV